jgi:hypothetical protein
MFGQFIFYTPRFYKRKPSKKPWKTPSSDPHNDVWWRGINREAVDQRKGLYYGQ